MNEDQNQLGTAPIGKLLFQMALPSVVAQLINMLYNIVDRIYIGHIPEVGALALTGVGVCMPIIMIVSAFASFVGAGGAPRASILMGRQDHESAEKSLGNCSPLCCSSGTGRCSWPLAPAQIPSAMPPSI